MSDGSGIEWLPRIDELRETPAKVRFLSIDPLLEELGKIDRRGIHWVIVGGESGPGARPMEERWVLSIRDQCQAAGCHLMSTLPSSRQLRRLPCARGR